jgi:hypothetical protein
MTMEWFARTTCRVVGHSWAGHQYDAQSDGVDMCTRCGTERNLSMHASTTTRPAKHLRNA